MEKEENAPNVNQEEEMEEYAREALSDAAVKEPEEEAAEETKGEMKEEEEALKDAVKKDAEGESDEESEKKPDAEKISTHIFALRTTANREDQVMDFITSLVQKKKLDVYSIIRPHGMRSYIFIEAGSRQAAEESARSIPYARGLLPKEVEYKEIEHMLEQVKRDINIRKNDIVEIISGPFKREQAKISRIDKVKEEVVVELLEAAVPIPITLKLDSVKVIRREEEGKEESED